MKRMALAKNSQKPKRRRLPAGLTCVWAAELLASLTWSLGLDSVVDALAEGPADDDDDPAQRTKLRMP